jgi:3-phosphoshikimate 1-carboxyvinyltransferase
MSGLAELTEQLKAAPGYALNGRIDVPGDKSISHRALILGGLAAGKTRIQGLLESRDVLDTAAAVRALGAEVTRNADGSWLVRGGVWHSPDAPIDCGNSGTGVRLLIGAAAGFPLTATFTGDASLRGRPMGRVIAPLTRMGARFDGGDRLPITVHGGGLGGLNHVNAPASAQVKSAILLAGLNAGGEIEIFEPEASRDHSETMLAAFGCDIDVQAEGGGRRIRLGASRTLTGTPIDVPGDPSSAAFPIVAALVTPGSEVTVRNVLVNPLRSGLFETLIEMGADLELVDRRHAGGEPVADIRVRHSALRGVTVPAERAPRMIDEYPILAIAAAFAEGETVMHGLAELRVKESDRLGATATGLAACGVEAAADGDSLRVRGQRRPAGGAAIRTHGDHRIAMSFLTLGLAAAAPVSVDEPGMIATSFPGFTELMQSLGASIGPA